MHRIIYAKVEFATNGKKSVLPFIREDSPSQLTVISKTYEHIDGSDTLVIPVELPQVILTLDSLYLQFGQRPSP